jgi:hypothetical protein
MAAIMAVTGIDEAKEGRVARTPVQEPLFPEMRRDCCYICGRWITQGGVYVGHGIARHRRCRPESPKKIS